MPTCITTVVILSMLAGIATAAEPVPYGHRDFVPTPERPLGWRADGNGYYPGATPPTEWCEGTPTPEMYETDRVRKWDLADDGTSKNILWKVPLPGWSLAHPLIVRDRVFVVGEPDFVACYDVKTGKQLWQRRILPLLCDGLPEAKALAGQKVLDLARAIFYTSGGGASTCGRNPGNVLTYGNGDNPSRQLPEESFARRRDFAAKLVAMIERFRPEVQAFGNADLLAAADQDLAILKDYASAKDLADLTARIKAKGSFQNLEKACVKKWGLHTGGVWWGYVGGADSTLASDGTRLYGTFNQGQVFCLDLDGKVFWAIRDRGDGSGVFHRSPILCGEVLVIGSIRKAGTKNGNLRIQGFDKGTGRLLWETTGNHSHQISPIVTAKATDGKSLPIILAQDPDNRRNIIFIRVSDGKVVGEVAFAETDMTKMGGSLVTKRFREDMFLANCYNQFGPYTPTIAFRLRLGGPDTVTAEEVWRTWLKWDMKNPEAKRRGIIGDSMVAVTDKHLISGTDLYSLDDGRLVSTVDFDYRRNCRLSRDGAPIVAGKYLILTQAFDGNDPDSRKRPDRRAIGRYAVVDISDPAKPKAVSDANFLGYRDPPADFIVKEYLSAFDPMDLAGCYRGAQSGFSYEMGGPIPAGDKIFIQSTAYLYCIGTK